MIHLTINVKNNRIPAIQAALKPALSQVVSKTAFDLKANVQKEMRAPKSGKLYRRGKRGIHRASKPGEAPAVDLSGLINSIQVDPETPALTMTVGTNVVYAMALEYGFPRRGLEPRPVWRPVTERMRKDYIAAMTLVLRSLK